MGTLIKDANNRLREQGGRMTSQRLLILETLEAMMGHPTAEELFEEVKKCDPRLNLSTVYRTLRWLEQENLVSARRFHEDRRQERFDPVHPSEHHHFLCLECKRVIEFDHNLINEIASQFATAEKVEVERASMVLYGICNLCAGEEK